MVVSKQWYGVPPLWCSCRLCTSIDTTLYLIYRWQENRSYGKRHILMIKVKLINWKEPKSRSVVIKKHDRILWKELRYFYFVSWHSIGDLSILLVLKAVPLASQMEIFHIQEGKQQRKWTKVQMEDENDTKASKRVKLKSWFQMILHLLTFMKKQKEEGAKVGWLQTSPCPRVGPSLNLQVMLVKATKI